MYTSVHMRTCTHTRTHTYARTHFNVTRTEYYYNSFILTLTFFLHVTQMEVCDQSMPPHQTSTA